MDKETVSKALKCPYKDYVEFSLAIVNLTDKEERAIIEVDVKGNTEERTSEKMNIATRTVQRLRKTAYEKICTVWQGNKLIEYMASMTVSK